MFLSVNKNIKKTNVCQTNEVDVATMVQRHVTIHLLTSIFESHVENH